MEWELSYDVNYFEEKEFPLYNVEKNYSSPAILIGFNHNLILEKMLTKTEHFQTFKPRHSKILVNSDSALF